MLISAFCFGAVIASVITAVLVQSLIVRFVPGVDAKLSGVLTLVYVGLGVLCSLFLVYDDIGKGGIEWWMPLVVTVVYLIGGIAFVSEVLRQRVKVHVHA